MVSFQLVRRGARVKLITMGPSRSSSLGIGSDSSAITSSGRTRGASDRSTAVELLNVPRAHPLPLEKVKRRVNLI